MEIDIIDDKKNPLFSRREIVCIVTKKGATPSKREILTQASSELKVKPECVFIDAVYQRYGRHTSEVHIKVYDKPELVPKSAKEGETPSEEKPAEEPKKEPEPAAPPEEKKEEKPEEKLKEESAPEEKKQEPSKEEKKETKPEPSQEAKEEAKEKDTSKNDAPEKEKK